LKARVAAKREFAGYWEYVLDEAIYTAPPHPNWGGAAMLGAVMSAYLVIPASLVPDLVDWYQHERGERHESVFFGLWMSVHQIGVGIAGFRLGACLSLFGYVGAADAQTARAVLGVRVAFADRLALRQHHPSRGG
jgi:Na+/melibiose symporter-like transporter